MGPEIGRLPRGGLRQHSHQDTLTANAQMPLNQNCKITKSVRVQKNLKKELLETIWFE